MDNWWDNVVVERCRYCHLISLTYDQGWVFAMAKTIFAGTVEKTGKNRFKNWQKPAKTGKSQRHHKLITDFITHILQAAFEPYYNSGTDSEHK